jgi:hypothetical protein
MLVDGTIRAVDQQAGRPLAESERLAGLEPRSGDAAG